MVQGRRAADELMLDWDDVKRLDASSTTVRWRDVGIVCREPIPRYGKGGKRVGRAGKGRDKEGSIRAR